tara:strand:+ start:943 stop:1596 length:654 start_codon:yes stop_codon:yes gene_type:complete
MYNQLINFGDEEFYAYPNKSLYWKRLNTLIVADLHLGKSISFAKNKQFLPPYDSKDTLDNLFTSLKDINPKKLIIVGDFIHDIFSVKSLTNKDYKKLKFYNDFIEFIWVKGNHDENIYLKNFKNYKQYKVEGIIFSHQPIQTSLYQICGHYHPKAKIFHKGKIIYKSSFVHNNNIFILPSFGSLTGGLNINHETITNVLGNKNISVYPIGLKKVFKL